MTDNPEARGSTPNGGVAPAGKRFDRVEGRHWGYSPDDVDDYFSRVEAAIKAPRGQDAPEFTSCTDRAR